MKRALPALFCLLAVPAFAHGDGGAVRYSREVGPYRVTVFTAPTPFRVGLVDVSVLVQDAESEVPIPDVNVTIHLQGPGGFPQLSIPATRAAATNKLYLAAKFELPSAGTWRCVVDVRGPKGPARAELTLTASEPLPAWTDLWLWLAWPIVPIALFALLVLQGRT